MRETQWRYKLVLLFREQNPGGFIWAHDAHFKTGFPDLTSVNNGVVKWIELKRIRNVKQNPQAKLSPTQVETLKKLSIASRGRCYVVGRCDETGDIRIESVGLPNGGFIVPGNEFHRVNWWNCLP